MASILRSGSLAPSFPSGKLLANAGNISNPEEVSQGSHSTAWAFFAQTLRAGDYDPNFKAYSLDEAGGFWQVCSRPPAMAPLFFFTGVCFLIVPPFLVGLKVAQG